ncbi:hypothetical protein [Actinophytocola glycyrrhizae]|uniref:Lipoprotein n=1 Tax=Actinophytocola glycyrrhizae TaxID=2044873 RepID=A0ABV9S8Z7_9PSEU
MARAALAGLLALLLALAGCAALADLGELRADLESAGYDATNINNNTTNGFTVLSIDVSMPDAVPTDEDAERVAEVVWRKYQDDFDQLLVTMNGAVRLDATPEDLTGLFGDRPGDVAAADREDGSSATTTVIVVVVCAVVFAGLMVLVWLRGRRPPPPPLAPPGHHQPGGYYQYPPPPPQG